MVAVAQASMKDNTQGYNEQLYTINELLKAYPPKVLNRSILMRAIKEGRIYAIKPGRVILIRKSDVDNYIQASVLSPFPLDDDEEREE